MVSVPTIKFDNSFANTMQDFIRNGKVPMFLIQNSLNSTKAWARNLGLMLQFWNPPLERKFFLETHR